MEKLDAEKKQVGGLFSQEYFFRIPEYQRPFSWDDDNFEDLVDDIKTAARNQEYFLGTIVLHRRDGLGIYDVVDGQQRLTSLMILLACLRDLVERPDFKDGIQSKLLQQANVVDGIPEKVRLEAKDRQFFDEVVITKGGTAITRNLKTLVEPEWRYAKAVEVFREHLANLDQVGLEDMVTFISQKCVIIVLATSDFDDAFRLFTIVNDRGKQLRRIDILKALNISPEAISTDTVRNRVAQQWEDIEKQLGNDTFESIFFLIRLILLKDKPQADLLKEFEDRIFGKKLRRGEAFFNLVFDYAELYEKIFVDRDFLQSDSAEYERFRGLIYIMDSEFAASEWRACLLSYAKKFGENNFFKFCLAIEKVYLEQWVSGIRKDERFAEYARILELIATKKKPETVIAGITFDSEKIMEAARGTDLYRARYGRYMLLRLELNASENDRVHEFSAKSVEHVLPQTPKEDSDWAKTHDLDRISEYVNTIGNLVLLSKSKNSAASNLDFKEKKTKYLEKRVSDYPRSIQILRIPKWTEKIIKDRTEEAANGILLDP